jgi:hypothetical protein
MLNTVTSVIANMIHKTTTHEFGDWHIILRSLTGSHKQIVACSCCVGCEQPSQLRSRYAHAHHRHLQFHGLVGDGGAQLKQAWPGVQHMHIRAACSPGCLSL